MHVTTSSKGPCAKVRVFMPIQIPPTTQSFSQTSWQYHSTVNCIKKISTMSLKANMQSACLVLCCNAFLQEYLSFPFCTFLPEAQMSYQNCSCLLLLFQNLFYQFDSKCY